jgi:regulator of protease activity HflC (stomatin/prohibitin superfamily)
MIVKLVMNVYYRITDPMKFGYHFADAHKLLQSIAWGQMVQYAASATLDEKLPEGVGAKRPQGLMSFGRGTAARELKGRIAAAIGDLETVRALGDLELLAMAEASQLDLGVRIVRVELIGCHPPKEAAEAFENVIAAERERDRLRYEAQTEARKMLAEAAGDPDLAWQLAQAIQFRTDLKGLLDRRADPAALRAAIEEAVAGARHERDRLQQEIYYEQSLGRVGPEAAKLPATAPAAPSDSAPPGGAAGEAEEADGAGLLVVRLRNRQHWHLRLLEALAKDPSPVRIAADFERYDQDVEELYDRTGGAAGVAQAQARAYRWKVEFGELARAEAFPTQMALYEKAPSVYRAQQLLAALAEGMAKRRKYILAMDRDRVELWLNLEQATSELVDLPLRPEK